MTQRRISAEMGGSQELWRALSNNFDELYKSIPTSSVKNYGAVGDGVADDTLAVQAALTAAVASGGNIVLPPGSYKVTAPLSVTGNSVSIVGLGRSSLLIVAHVGNVFNVSGQDFVCSDMGLTFTQTATRTGALVFNPTGLLGSVRNVTVLGSSSFNNGGFAGHLAAGGSSWTYRDIVFIGGTTWDYLFKVKGTVGTVSGFLLQDWVVFSTTFGDAGFIFDTLTDTVKMAHCQIVGATAAPVIHVRNTGAGQAPRWVRMIDVSTEAASLGPCLKIDDGRDIRYLDGYFASALNAALLNGGTSLDISHNIITNIQQHGIVQGAVPVGVRVVDNDFDDGAGLATTNTYDCINVANGATNFTYEDNRFRAPSAAKPRYAINISGSSCGFFGLADNDTTVVAWGTAAFNNASTSAVQRIWNNPGIADVTKDSAGASTLGATQVGTFGCNGAGAQAAAASGGALAAYATGAFGLDSNAHMTALFNLVVAMRAALVANGIMS